MGYHGLDDPRSQKQQRFGMFRLNLPLLPATWWQYIFQGMSRYRTFPLTAKSKIRPRPLHIPTWKKSVKNTSNWTERKCPRQTARQTDGRTYGRIAERRTDTDSRGKTYHHTVTVLQDKYNRTSMAQMASLEPWKYVRDRGSSCQWVLLRHAGQEA